jgi:hypothetical protein
MTRARYLKRGINFPEAQAPTGRPFRIIIICNSRYSRRDGRKDPF